MARFLYYQLFVLLAMDEISLDKLTYDELTLDDVAFVLYNRTELDKVELDKVSLYEVTFLKGFSLKKLISYIEVSSSRVTYWIYANEHSVMKQHRFKFSKDARNIAQASAYIFEQVIRKEYFEQNRWKGPQV